MSHKTWWNDTGSGIAIEPNEESESHARRVSEIAWRQAIIEIRDVLRIRSDCAEAKLRKAIAENSGDLNLGFDKGEAQTLRYVYEALLYETKRPPYEKKRYRLNFRTGKVFLTDNPSDFPNPPYTMAVEESDLPYLENPGEGFELRRPGNGDEYINVSGDENIAVHGKITSFVNGECICAPFGGRRWTRALRMPETNKGRNQ